MSPRLVLKPFTVASIASTSLRLSSLSSSRIASRAFSTTSVNRFRNSFAKMGVTEITSAADFQKLVTESKDTIVIDFFAEWCGPCKAISPKVDQLSAAHTGTKFYKVDVDKVPEVAGELGVSAMPTFLFYKGGEQVNKVVGANPPAILAAVESVSQ